MSSLTTEQQRDDLAARRRRKQARETAAPNGDAVAALQSSQAARGLLRDVITGIPDQSPAGAGLEEGVSHTRARETDRPDSPPRVPTSRGGDLGRRAGRRASPASQGGRLRRVGRGDREWREQPTQGHRGPRGRRRCEGTLSPAAQHGLAALVAREATSESLVGSSCRRARRRTRRDRAGGRQLR